MKSKNENNDVVPEETSYRITGFMPIDITFSKIDGLKEMVTSERSPILPVYPDSMGKEYQKRPMQFCDEPWTVHNYTLEELQTTYQGCNVGIKLGPDSGYLGCIDIDGNGEGDIKIKSREYLYNVLKKHMDNFDDFLVEKTAQEGYHIYFRYNPESEFIKKHRVSKSFAYSPNCPIRELAETPLGGAIEIEDGRKRLPDGKVVCSKFIVFSGSVYNGKFYEPISEQRDIRKLPVVDDIEAQVEKALVLGGFKPYVEERDFDFNLCEYKTGNKKIPIPDENIAPLGKFLGDLYRHFHEGNCKFYATQALAGYLAKRTDKESALKLAEAIVGEVGHLFNSVDAFYTTLLNDFNNPPADGVNAQGGNKFYNDYCKDFIDYHVFWETMVHLMGGNMKFCIGDKNAKKKDFIVLNRENRKVTLNTYSETENKQGDVYDVLMTSKDILGFCPVSLERIINPLNPKDSKLVLHCISYSGIEVIEARDFESLLSTVKSINGAVLSKNNSADALNHIINKFYELDLVTESEKSSLSGIFKINGELVRYDENGDEVPIVKPDGGKIAEALSLIEDMISIIPHKDGEVGLLLRKSFLYPFHYYFKSKNRQVKFILLSGVGYTLKSTLGEMCLSIYQKLDYIGEESNVIGGGSFDTEYRIGRAMCKSSMGFLVNEPDTAFTTPSLTQLLKVCTTDLVIRSPKGRVTYSYQSPIFATNIDLPDKTEFIRRQDDFNFTPTYVVNDKILEDLASLLNADGINNKRFEELRVIGDFIVYFISKDLNLLDLPYDDLELRIVEALEKVSDKDLSWLKMSKSDLGYEAEDLGSYDEYDNVMDLFVHELKMIYNINRNTILLTGKTPNDIGSIPLYEDVYLKLLIRKGHMIF